MPPASAKQEPPLTFSTFVISLASSALAHLGQVDNPAAHPTGTDLALAKQSIDLIDMLVAKTKGNLEPDEARLLDAVHRELHEKFAAASK